MWPSIKKTLYDNVVNIGHWNKKISILETDIGCKGISQIIGKLMYDHHKKIVHACICGMELRWPAQVPHSYSDRGRVASVTLVGDTPGCKYKLETQHKYDSVNVGFSLGVVNPKNFFFTISIFHPFLSALPKNIVVIGKGMNFVDKRWQLQPSVQ